MDFSIRLATEADAEAIVSLLDPIIQSAKYTVMASVSIAEQIAFIRNFPKRGVFLLSISHQQKILGIQDVMPISSSPVFKHVGAISTFVSLDAHRKGIGRNLCKTTFQKARENGFQKLTATIRADNLQAIAFYKSQGFTIIGTAQKHALIQGKYIDEILAEKWIA